MKACLWCCMSGVKRLNSGVKRGEVIYQMCSEHTHLHRHSLCCYWFPSIWKMGSTERESIGVTRKRGGRQTSGWCRVNECLFSPDRWASYFDKGGGDVWARPHMHTTFRCGVFVCEAEPGWQAGERDTMWRSKADLLLRFMVSVFLLTAGWTLPSLVGQSSSTPCVSPCLVRSLLKNCDLFLEMPWIVGVVWSKIWNEYSDTWGITVMQISHWAENSGTSLNFNLNLVTRRVCVQHAQRMEI